MLRVGVEHLVRDGDHADPFGQSEAERDPVAVGLDRADVDRGEVGGLGSIGVESGRDQPVEQPITLGLEVGGELGEERVGQPQPDRRWPAGTARR